MQSVMGSVFEVLFSFQTACLQLARILIRDGNLTAWDLGCLCRSHMLIMNAETTS